MLQNNLENLMYAHVSQFGERANLIVMHPQTWQNLCKEVWSNDSMAIYKHDPSLRYKGVRVLRSLDMVDGLFEVR
jgi:hypothetical protein